MVEKNENLRKKLKEKYRELEEQFKPMGKEVSTYTTPVNFKESLNSPIHRWYGYKEGFSPSFVKYFITKYTTDDNSIIFDPFGGVGTTALESIKLGYDAISMDVSPLGVFASKVKTRNYTSKDIFEITKYVNILKRLENYPKKYIIENQTIAKYFDSETYESLLKIRSFILDIDIDTVQDLFLLALLSLIDEISTHHKNGNGVKKKLHLPQPLNFHELCEKIIEKLEVYLHDIQNTKIIGKADIIQHSCIVPYSLSKKADIVLTSPPYANCFDYSKVYLSELWIGNFFKERSDQERFRENSIASHVHYIWKRKEQSKGSETVNSIIIPILKAQKLWSNRIPEMLFRYFSDLDAFLHHLSKNLTNGAIVGIVVGNSVYGGVPISVDTLLAEMAVDQGFQCLGIKVYRKVVASSQQMILLDDEEKHYVRESLVILRWK
jgi:DNA modification methylase